MAVWTCTGAEKRPQARDPGSRLEAATEHGLAWGPEAQLVSYGRHEAAQCPCFE